MQSLGSKFCPGKPVVSACAHARSPRSASNASRHVVFNAAAWLEACNRTERCRRSDSCRTFVVDEDVCGEEVAYLFSFRVLVAVRW